MFKLLSKQIIANNIKRLEVKAADIARKVKPGQFVMVMPGDSGQKISLPVVDADAQRGVISLIVEEKDGLTKELAAIQINDHIPSILGPLGMPVKIQNTKVVACVGYGIGIAQLLLLSKAYRPKETKVVGIIGAKTKKALVLESQMRLACNKLYVTTDDGTYERKGLISDLFRGLIKKESISLVYAAGSVLMMAAVAKYAKENNVESIVFVNPPMTDGIGICGSCRMKVGGKDVFACVDGPHFNGEGVDFHDLSIRTDG